MLRKFLLRSCIITSFVVFLTNTSFAQDPEFTQFYANPLYLNPAFAGTSHCPRVSMNYRNQWPGISATYVTSSFSYDQHVDGLSGGIGLLVWNDREGEGTIQTNNVSGIYSYQIPITRRFSLKAGIQGTWGQRGIDWSKLTFGDQIHSRRGFIYETAEIKRDKSVNYVDFSAGVLGFSEKYFVGFAVNHLTEPNETVIAGESPLPRKYTFHAGAVLPVESKGEAASLSPNLLAQLQGDFLQVNFGMYFSKGPIIGGLWYRYNDSFIALLGFEVGILKFGYSYDITISKLTNKSGGAHELSTGLQFDCKPKKRRFRTISCPSF